MPEETKSAPAQLLVFFFQAGEAQRIVHREQELLGGERLFQEVHRAQAGGAHCHLDVRLPRHHHHRRGHAQVLDLLQ